MKTWELAHDGPKVLEILSPGKEYKPLTKDEINLFWSCENHDDPKMKGHYYDKRWLIARLVTGYSASVRYIAKDAAYALIDPVVPPLGYWQLTLAS
jgi:hypothetical protein